MRKYVLLALLFVLGVTGCLFTYDQFSKGLENRVTGVVEYELNEDGSIKDVNVIGNPFLIDGSPTIAIIAISSISLVVTVVLNVLFVIIKRLWEFITRKAKHTAKKVTNFSDLESQYVYSVLAVRDLDKRLKDETSSKQNLLSQLSEKLDEGNFTEFVNTIDGKTDDELRRYLSK